MTKEFELLFREDQKQLERWLKEGSSCDKRFFRKNKELREKIETLLKKREKVKPKDYFISAIIFQHAFNVSSSKKAVKYSKKAVNEGYSKGKWLIASTTDRLLQLQGKPQKFGTQPKDMHAKKLKIYKLDNTITDRMRKEYGLPSLKILKKEMETYRD